jgi:hypothetical protein
MCEKQCIEAVIKCIKFKGCQNYNTLYIDPIIDYRMMDCGVLFITMPLETLVVL